MTFSLQSSWSVRSFQVFIVKCSNELRFLCYSYSVGHRLKGQAALQYRTVVQYLISHFWDWNRAAPSGRARHSSTPGVFSRLGNPGRSPYMERWAAGLGRILATVTQLSGQKENET